MSLWQPDKNVVGGIKVPKVDPKKITEKRVKILEDRLQQIKEYCTKAKNSATSKNDALKTIKNMCNAKDEEQKMWKDLLGDAYDGK